MNRKTIRRIPAALLAAALLFLLACPASVNAEGAVLPLDYREGGKPLKAEGWVFEGKNPVSYEDSTIKVTFEREEVTHLLYCGNAAGETVTDESWIVRIKIQDPSQLRTAISRDTYTGQARADAAAIANSKNAVVAMDGDFFKYENDTGYVVRQGELIRDCADRGLFDMLLIDSEGDFHAVYSATTERINAYVEENLTPIGRTVMNTFNFGPFLVEDGRVSEAFCLQELDKAARLGVTIYQIDDGWQMGKSPASVVKGGSFDDIWQRSGYWDVDPVKFPHGLKPVVDKAATLGIEIGLWFNPSVQDDLADWEKDAAVLTGLWKQYGIRIFKIDGLVIPSKRAERNLRKMLDRVREETGDDVIFNMDVTNGRRIGYNWFAEYGNIFLENRYTDWGNYYPYKTLRNLWQLARYVAPERFQIEFLNPWRNPDKYPWKDPFSPENYSFDYLAAITLAAQPLAWMEASNLPEEAFSTGELLKKWLTLAPDLHEGAILPIGEEPSGRCWTGFQSVKNARQGYLLVYREDTPTAKARIRTWLPAGRRIKCKPVLGNGKPFCAKVDENGGIRVKLRDANSFAMYTYTVL